MWSGRVRGLAALVAVFALSVPAIATADGPVVISAHRGLGDPGVAENSLDAFTSAAQAGETDIEGDAFVTKDSVLVMSHDSPLRAPRCSGAYLDRSLRTLTAAQVTTMTCGGAPVPRLDAVLAAVRPYLTAHPRIEIKHETGDTSAQRSADAVLLARQLSSAGMTSRSLLQDFDWANTTRSVRAASPGQRVSALTNSITVAQVASAHALGVTDFSYVSGLSTGFWNAQVAASGLTSTVWTVDTPPQARVLRAEGVGTIISDVPETLRTALADPASQCTLERYSTPFTTRGTTLAAGATSYRTVPARSPDGRVVETGRWRVRAWTTSGTATLQIAPRGTPTGSQWEQRLTVSPTSAPVVLEVAGGDAGGVRITNASTRAVGLEVALVGGAAYGCP